MERSKRWGMAAVKGLAFLIGGGAAWAQAPGAAGMEADMAQQLTLSDLFMKGGVLMYPLAALSVIAVAFIIYFFFALRREQVVPELLRRDVLRKVEDGQLEDVRTACNYRPCAFSEVVLAALDFAQPREKLDAGLFKEVLEGEGGRQAVSLQGQTQYLLDVAVIAPMLGLLGTIFGMIRAFNVVALDLAKAKPMLLAAGVAEALITTAAGLLIGIPSMAFYAYFRGRASRLISELELASGQVLSAFLRRRS